MMKVAMRNTKNIATANTTGISISRGIVTSGVVALGGVDDAISITVDVSVVNNIADALVVMDNSESVGATPPVAVCAAINKKIVTI